MGIAQSRFTGLRGKEEDEQQRQQQLYPFLDSNKNYKKPYNGSSFGLSSFYTLFKNLLGRIFPFAKSRKPEPILPVVNPTNNPPFSQISSSSDSSPSPNAIYTPVRDLNLQLQSDHYSTTTWPSAMETESNGNEDEGLHYNKQMDVIINVPSLDYQSLARTSTFDVVDSAFISFDKEVKEDEQVVEEKQKNKKINNEKKVEEEKQKKKIKNKKQIKCCVVDSAFIGFKKEKKENKQIEGEKEKNKKMNNNEKVEEAKQKKKIKNKKRVEEEKEIKCVVHEGKWIKHYHSSHKILLLGEGDFSFSASLALAFGSASNMIATSLNLPKFLKKNYGNAMVNINNLTSRGCKVVHGVDATQIASNLCLGKMKFDRIIYNFPFAGFFNRLSKDEVLEKHRRLVSLFLKNAKQMIGENGEIHITHKTNGIQKEWNIENIASSHGLRLIEAAKFNRLDYPGYNTKFGFGGDGNFECYPAKTYKFGLKK